MHRQIEVIRARQAVECIDQEMIQGAIFTLFVGKTVEQLDHVGGVRPPQQVIAQSQVGIDGLCLSDDGDFPAPCQEQVDACERLQMTCLARSRLANAYGNCLDFAHLKCK